MKTSGPEPLSEILGRLFTARGWGRQEARRSLEEAWEQAAGPYARETQVGGIRRGVLEIMVRSPVVLQELAGFRKGALLAALQAALPNTSIKDLRFQRVQFTSRPS